jgi:signal peptidase I
MNPISRLIAWYKRPNKSTLESWIETIIIVVPIAFLIRTYVFGLYQVPSGSMETTMLVGERFLADKFTPLFTPIRAGDIISFNDPNFDYSDNKVKRLWEEYVWGPVNVTKRVIGVPGDRIQGKIENDKPVVYKNGVKLEEPYVNSYPLIASFSPETRRVTHYTYDPNKSYDDQPFYRMNFYNVTMAKKAFQAMGQQWLKEPYTPAYCDGRNVDEYDISLGKNQYWVMGDNRQGSYDCRFWNGTGKPLDGSHIHGKIVLRLWSIDSEESWWILDLLRNPIDFWRRVRWSRFFQILR